MVQSYLIFAAAFLVSVATPGPDLVVVTSKVLARSGFVRCAALVAGIVAGKLLLLATALLGLAVVAATLGPFFVAIKLAGACYLAYLGVKMWRKSEAGQAPELPSIGRGLIREAGLGFVLSTSNPLAILFYAALVPNVIDLGKLTLEDVAALGGIVGFGTIGVYGLYGALAGRVGMFFRSPNARRKANRSAGTAMIGAAIMVAAR